MMEQWRENFKGVQYLHKPTNFIVTGAVDDIWIDKKPSPNPLPGKGEGLLKGGVLYVVDYKATSKEKVIKALDEDWQGGYKRQMEIYQWLLRKNGFKVSDTGYFVYCNGRTDKKAFDGKLEFDINIIPYKGNAQWVEGALKDAHKCLKSNKIPKSGKNCDYCEYREAVESVSL